MNLRLVIFTNSCYNLEGNIKNLILKIKIFKIKYLKYKIFLEWDSATNRVLAFHLASLGLMHFFFIPWPIEGLFKPPLGWKQRNGRWEIGHRWTEVPYTFLVHVEIVQTNAVVPGPGRWFSCISHLHSWLVGISGANYGTGCDCLLRERAWTWCGDGDRRQTLLVLCCDFRKMFKEGEGLPQANWALLAVAWLYMDRPSWGAAQPCSLESRDAIAAAMFDLDLNVLLMVPQSLPWADKYS